MTSNIISIAISTLLLLAVIILTIITNKKPEHAKTIIKLQVVICIICVVKLILSLVGLF